MSSLPSRQPSDRAPGAAPGHPTRVHILGASGSGVTTLGQALAAHLGCRLLDVDDYFWLPTDPPFQETRPRPERQVLLGADLPPDESWVVSGSLTGWGDLFIPLFDLVVFLVIPQDVRLARLAARERRRFGEDALAPGGNMHENHATFMAWAASYDDGDLSMRSRRRHEQWLQDLPCPVLRLEGVGTVEAHLDRVIQRLGLAVER
jgi:adenylate kinase family enzyme